MANVNDSKTPMTEDEMIRLAHEFFGDRYSLPEISQMVSDAYEFPDHLPLKPDLFKPIQSN